MGCLLFEHLLNNVIWVAHGFRTKELGFLTQKRALSLSKTIWHGH